MPARTKNISWPAWVEELSDPCLEEAVREALIARDSAKRNGALQHNVFQAAEATLDQVAVGRIKGKDACRKAAVAVRKFSTAGECSQPTASRGLSGLRRRKGK